MKVYYNEFDAKTAAWLRQLIADGLIPAGDVDERSICDVQADDVRGYDQCHFFAGIGGWAYALQLAGWGDRPVWTGSCPCQPFSHAGKRKGHADERHLWPEFYRLIRECKPAVIFGEQVASSDVVGRSPGTDAKVQQVLDREAVFSVLRELERQSSAHVRGVPELREKEQAEEQRERGSRSQGVAEEVSWPCSCECGETPGKNEGASVLFRCSGHPATSGRGAMRGNRVAVRPIDATGVELPISRPNRLSEGIHTREHAGRDICPKCGGQRLGGEHDFADCVGDPVAAARAFKRLVGAHRREPQTSPRRHWLDGVFADLEAEGYACGAVVLGAHSVGAPHIRQRLWWVADAERERAGAGVAAEQGHARQRRHRPAIDGATGRLPNPASRGRGERGDEAQQGGCGHADGGGAGGLGIPVGERLESHAGQEHDRREPGRLGADAAGSVAEAGCNGRLPNPSGNMGDGGMHQPQRGAERRASDWWADAEWIACADGKARRIKPGLAPLDDGIQARVVRLRGYGNAIVPQAAAEFIRAYIESTEAACL